MHRHDRLRLRGDLCPNLLRIDVERLRFDIDEHRFSSNPRNRSPRREKSKRRTNHFVPALNIQRHQRAQKSIRPAGNANRMPGIAIRRQVLLKTLHHRPKNEVLAVANFIDHLANLAPDIEILVRQIQ